EPGHGPRALRRAVPRGRFRARRGAAARRGSPRARGAPGAVGPRHSRGRRDAPRAAAVRRSGRVERVLTRGIAAMPLIAMTREMGSLGKDVAAGVAGRANKKVVYHEIIEPLANKMRLRKSHVERFLEGKSGIWERLTTDRTSLSIFTADETFKFLRDDSTAVIRRWGAVHLLRNVPHVLRVRVCAPLETRIARMMERLATDN